MLMIYQVELLEWPSTPAACKPPAGVFSLNLFSKKTLEIIVSSIDQLFKSHLGVIAIQIDSQTRPYGFWFSKRSLSIIKVAEILPVGQKWSSLKWLKCKLGLGVSLKEFSELSFSKVHRSFITGFVANEQNCKLNHFLSDNLIISSL